MTYELRIYPLPLPAQARPSRTEPLEADDDTAALARMRAFAATLPRRECVFLHRPDRIRSLGSEDGQA